MVQTALVMLLVWHAYPGGKRTLSGLLHALIWLQLDGFPANGTVSHFGCMTGRIYDRGSYNSAPAEEFVCGCRRTTAFRHFQWLAEGPLPSSHPMDGESKLTLSSRIFDMSFRDCTFFVRKSRSMLASLRTLTAPSILCRTTEILTTSADIRSILLRCRRTPQRTARRSRSSRLETVGHRCRCIPARCRCRHAESEQRARPSANSSSSLRSRGQTHGTHSPSPGCFSTMRSQCKSSFSSICTIA